MIIEKIWVEYSRYSVLFSFYNTNKSLSPEFVIKNDGLRANKFCFLLGDSLLVNAFLKKACRCIHIISERRKEEYPLIKRFIVRFITDTNKIHDYDLCSDEEGIYSEELGIVDKFGCVTHTIFNFNRYNKSFEINNSEVIPFESVEEYIPLISDGSITHTADESLLWMMRKMYLLDGMDDRIFYRINNLPNDENFVVFCTNFSKCKDSDKIIELVKKKNNLQFIAGVTDIDTILYKVNNDSIRILNRRLGDTNSYKEFMREYGNKRCFRKAYKEFITNE